MKDNHNSKWMYDHGRIYKVLEDTVSSLILSSEYAYSEGILDDFIIDLSAQKEFWFECHEVQKIKEHCLEQIEELSKEKDPEMVPSRTAKATASKIIKGLYCFKNASGYNSLFDKEYRNHEPDIMPNGSNGIIIEFIDGSKNRVSVNIYKNDAKGYIYRNQNLNYSFVDVDISMTNIVKHLVWLYEPELILQEFLRTPSNYAKKR